MGKKKLSITWYIAGAILTSIIIVVIVSLFFVRNKIDQLFIDEVSLSNTEIVNSAVTQLESTLNEQINTIIGVEVAHHNLSPVGNVLAIDYYETILNQNEYIVSMEAISLDGTILYSSRETENRVGVSVVTDDLYQQIDGIHQVHIDRLVYDTTGHNLALQVAYSGEDIIIYARISIDFFHDFGDEFKTSFDNKEIMILDENGIYLYDSVNDQHLIQSRFTDMDELLELDNLNNNIMTINETKSIVSHSDFFVNDWSVIIFEDVNSSLALNRLNLTYFTVTMLSIITLLTGVYLAFNIVFTKSLKELVTKFKLGKEAKFELVTEESMFKEIDDIRTNYNSMIVELDYLIERLQHIAYYDNLTGVPSKHKAREDFLTNNVKLSSKTAFIYIDIVRFKIINDNFGYDVGDKGLIQIANLLSSEFEFLYRIEGDEFLAIHEIVSIEYLEDLVRQLEDLLYENVLLSGSQVKFKLKFGLSFYDKDGTQFEELFKKAVIATESVKDTLTKTYVFYDDSKTEEYERSSRIELIIQKALDRGDFYTVFQPIIDVSDNSIRGFEALSRWQDRELGNISPDEFIPVLESRKDIHVLDVSVLNKALRLSKFLLDEFNLKLVASVNISVETIMKDNFTNTIEEALKRFEVEPELLELEITESTIIVDFEQITEKMNYLRRKGVKFSEDDFGDRYSSLTYLSRLKIDTLKISKNFLSSILSNVESRVLVQTILTLSKKLGFFTIVEGVEDIEIYDLFKKYGCDYVQGYLFYKPMIDKDLIEVIKTIEKEKTNEK